VRSIKRKKSYKIMITSEAVDQQGLDGRKSNQEGKKERKD
jgi:hypothetical protein